MEEILETVAILEEYPATSFIYKTSCGYQLLFLSQLRNVVSGFKNGLMFSSTPAFWSSPMHSVLS